MDGSQQDFVAETYAPRAQAYVESSTHAQGADLDQMEAVLSGAGIGRALDLGCGGGHVTYRAAPLVGSIVACDLTAAMVAAVARTAAERGLSNVSVECAPAENLPFGSASFDAVLCRFTAHHWADVEAGLREARRVLKPGGRAVFMDSVAPADRTCDSHLQAVELLRDPSHVRNFSVAEWLAMLARAGFAAETVTERKLRMIFPVWIARTRTPALNADAVRAIQAAAPPHVKTHFAIGEDGSFDLDTMVVVGRGG